MALGDGDLGVFFAEFGVEVVFGAQLTRGNLDEIGVTGQIVGLMVDDQTHVLEIASAAFNPQPGTGAKLQVDGRPFTVRGSETVDDGLIVRLALKKGWK